MYGYDGFVLDAQVAQVGSYLHGFCLQLLIAGLSAIGCDDGRPVRVLKGSLLEDLMECGCRIWYCIILAGKLEDALLFSGEEDIDVCYSDVWVYEYLSSNGLEAKEECFSGLCEE